MLRDGATRIIYPMFADKWVTSYPIKGKIMTLSSTGQRETGVLIFTRRLLSHITLGDSVLSALDKLSVDPVISRNLPEIQDDLDGIREAETREAKTELTNALFKNDVFSVFYKQMVSDGDSFKMHHVAEIFRTLLATAAFEEKLTIS